MDDELRRRIEKIEELLNRYFENEYMQYTRRILSTYLQLIDIYIEHGRISPSVIFPEVKDPISREILETVFYYGKLNTSRITEELRKTRGKASRRIVREKLEKLVDMGLVECEEGKNEKLYFVSDYSLKKWLKVLGIDIKSEEHGKNRGDENG